MTRAQRLVDEFEEGAAWAGGFSIRHGIAAVLQHLAYTDNELGLTPFGGHCQARDQLLAIASELDHE
jgi:hypothetical protein